MDLLENESLAQLDPQQKAELIPLQYIETISDPIKTDHQPALIFSRENLLTIKRYVKAVQHVPGVSTPLEEWINFDLLRVDSEEVAAFIDDLRRHVKGWEPLEYETQTLSVKLENFAGNFIAEGKGLVMAIRNMNGSSLADVNDKVLDQLQGEPLVEGDGPRNLTSIAGLLEDLRDMIARMSNDIVQVQTRADRFYRDVGENLLPKVLGLQSAFDLANSGDRAREFAEALQALDAEIEVQSSVVSGYSNLRLFGLVFSPLGVVVTESLFGDLAKSAKDGKKELLRRREQLVHEMESFTPQLARLGTLSGLLNDIKDRLGEVNTAAWNLRYVIRTLGEHASISGEELGLIDTNVSLERFARRIDRVVRPWSKIGNISHELAVIFNDVMDSFDKEN